MLLCDSKREKYWDTKNKPEWLPMLYLLFLILLAILIGIGIYISI